MKEYNFSDYQCWHIVLEKIFNIKKINRLLEFGLGNGTLFLADNVNVLHSVELAVSQTHKQWFNIIRSKMVSYNNWTADLIMCPESIIIADATVLKNKNYYLEDKGYSSELRNIVEPFIEEKWDLVFVDPGIHLRGEMVSLCIEKKVPIIVTHDTEFPILYGYDLVELKNYEYINFDTVHGTGVYINKQDPSNSDILAAFNHK